MAGFSRRGPKTGSREGCCICVLSIISFSTVNQSFKSLRRRKIAWKTFKISGMLERGGWLSVLRCQGVRNLSYIKIVCLEVGTEISLEHKRNLKVNKRSIRN